MDAVIVILKAVWPDVADWQVNPHGTWWSEACGIEVNVGPPPGARAQGRMAEVRVGDAGVAIGFGPTDAAAVMHGLLSRAASRAVEYERAKRAAQEVSK